MSNIHNFNNSARAQQDNWSLSDHGSDAPSAFSPSPVSSRPHSPVRGNPNGAFRAPSPESESEVSLVPQSPSPEPVFTRRGPPPQAAPRFQGAPFDRRNATPPQPLGQRGFARQASRAQAFPGGFPGSYEMPNLPPPVARQAGLRPHSPESLASEAFEPYFPGRQPLGARRAQQNIPPPPPARPFLAAPALREGEARLSRTSSGVIELHEADAVRVSDEGRVTDGDNDYQSLDLPNDYASFVDHTAFADNAPQADRASLADGSSLGANQGFLARHKGKLAIAGLVIVAAVIAAAVIGTKAVQASHHNAAAVTNGTSTSTTMSSTTSHAPTTTAKSSASTSAATTSVKPTSSSAPQPTQGALTFKADAPLLLQQSSLTGLTGFTCAQQVPPVFTHTGNVVLTPNNKGGYDVTGPDGFSGTSNANKGGVFTVDVGTQQGTVMLSQSAAACTYTAAGTLGVHVAPNNASFAATLNYAVTGDTNCPIILTTKGAASCNYIFQGSQSA